MPDLGHTENPGHAASPGAKETVKLPPSFAYDTPASQTTFAPSASDADQRNLGAMAEPSAKAP